ncbi:DUF4105 domain-containing protein [Psychrobacter sp. GP33]|uniref:Lnb N-terminal periplasmic domain-containing protein n=1 Tax=Psychrobacter sp. GP33 TaxID=2758709 RepID=UPI0015FBE9AB|nr:DUF4105 domain-containing protein [Psychrobacter sp. GP33]
MSPRAFISRLFTKRIQNQSLASTRQYDSEKTHSWPHSWRYYLLQFFIVKALILSAVWLLMAIWYQFGGNSTVTWFATTVIIGLLTALLTVRYLPKRVLSKQVLKSFINNQAKNKASKWLTGLYVGVWLTGAGWFVSITPQQLRDWKPEVGQILSYTRDANNSDLITFTNVRNFDWHTGDDATERWETRTVDMSKLSGVDVINSYWMGPLIAHTLVSFRFEDDRPLSFSLEIRKENGESFSALGGFFKRYELSLIASEERDIIYTRSNARGEQVYLFPVSHLQQHEVKSLFESYLIAADELNAKPEWYNTLTSNCTNIIFYMARVVSGERLPWDYRIWVSGWLPNYLYDLGMLDASPQNNTQSATNAQSWSMDTWYERAHINPKVKGFNNGNNIHGSEFSMQIRQGIPIPPLADRHAIRVNPN